MPVSESGLPHAKRGVPKTLSQYGVYDPRFLRIAGLDNTVP